MSTACQKTKIAAKLYYTSFKTQLQLYLVSSSPRNIIIYFISSKIYGVTHFVTKLPSPL